MKNTTSIEETEKTYFLFVLVVIGYLAKYSLNVVLAHHLPPALYGDYSIAIKVLAVLITTILFGTNVGAQRFFGGYLHDNKKLTAVHYMAWNIKLVGFTFLLSFFLAVFFLILAHVFSLWKIRDIQNYHLAFYMLWIAPFAAFATLFSCFLLSTGKALTSTTLTNIIRYLTQLVFFGVVIFFDLELDNLTIVAALFFTFAMIAWLSLLLMDAECMQIIRLGLREISLAHVKEAKWFLTSSKFIMNNILFMIINVADLMIIEILPIPEDNVGHYAAVLVITGSMWLVSVNLYQTIKPKVSSLLTSEKGKKTLQVELNQINFVVFSILTVLCAAILYFAPNLLLHFGPTYIHAYHTLIILTIGTYVAALTRFSMVLLVYAGYEDVALKVNYIELASIILLTIPATYYYGIRGAAIATSFILILKSIIGVYLVRKSLGIRCLIIL